MKNEIFILEDMDDDSVPVFLREITKQKTWWSFALIYLHKLQGMCALQERLTSNNTVWPVL